MKEIKHLIAVIETVKRYGTPEDPEAADWFLCGFNEYMVAREYRSLDKIFGLTAGRGTPSQRTQYMKAIRNNYLKKAFETIAPEKPDTVRCDILAEETRAMESRFYRNWKKAGGPPALCTDLRKNLYYARDTGQSLPTKMRYLFNLVMGY